MYVTKYSFAGSICNYCKADIFDGKGHSVVFVNGYPAGICKKEGELYQETTAKLKEELVWVPSEQDMENYKEQEKRWHEFLEKIKNR